MSRNTIIVSYWKLQPKMLFIEIRLSSVARYTDWKIFRYIGYIDGRFVYLETIQCIL
jgi:hypothetical protein